MRIAILQMNAGIDPDDNASILVRAITDAKKGGAQILFTPEMSNFLDRNRQRAATTIRQEAQDMVLAQCRRSCAETGMNMLIGSLALQGEQPDDKWRNRSVLISPDGEIVARYDKMHLFDVDLETGESWRESAVYGAGDHPVVVKQDWGTLGLSVCYDLRFPSLYEQLSNAGAEIISVPAAFTVPTGIAHWHVLLRARAIESSCFVIAPAQCGEHSDGRVTYGHSLVVDPSGHVVLDMGHEIGLGYADIDRAKVHEVRAQIPSLANRREIGEVTII